MSIRVFILMSLLGVFVSDRARAAPPPPSAAETLTLSALFRNALQNSETVKMRSEDRVQAKEKHKQASGTLLPQVNAVGTYLKQDPAGVSPSTPSSQKNLRLTANQYLFQGGSEYAALRQTNRNVEYRDELVRAEKDSVYLSVARLYVLALSRKAQFDELDELVKLYDDQIKELKKRASIGRSRQADVLQVQSQRSVAAAQMQTAERDYNQYRVELASLTRTDQTAPLQDLRIEPKALEPIDAYLKDSLANPNLQAAFKNREAVEENIGIARGGHFPSLALGGNYYLHREGGFSANGEWDVNLALTLPLFAGGVTQSKVREATSQYRSAEVNADLVARQTRDDVTTNYQAAQIAAEELKAFKDALDLSQKNYQQIKRDFGFGLVTVLDTLTALQTYENAKQSYDVSAYTYTLTRIQLDVAANRGPKE